MNYEEDFELDFSAEDKEHLHQPSQYEVALGKYNTDLKEADIAARTAQLIEQHLMENNTREVKKFLLHCIDLTTLKCTDSEPDVMRLTQRVNEFVDVYPDLENVAAICVYPNMAEIVNDTLEADHVKIACVGAVNGYKQHRHRRCDKCRKHHRIMLCKGFYAHCPHPHSFSHKFGIISLFAGKSIKIGVI